MTCPCMYPLMFVDNRYGDKVEYMSIPEDVFDEMGCIRMPELEVIEEEGFDGKLHKYMGVIWKDPKDATTKKYDVNDHIVIAGCDGVVDGKKMSCKKKELYVVLHPIEEWKEHHIVKIKAS